MLDTLPKHLVWGIRLPMPSKQWCGGWIDQWKDPKRRFELYVSFAYRKGSFHRVLRRIQGCHWNWLFFTQNAQEPEDNSAFVQEIVRGSKSAMWCGIWNRSTGIAHTSGESCCCCWTIHLYKTTQPSTFQGMISITTRPMGLLKETT